MTLASSSPSITWVHFGDLHIAEAGEENLSDFVSMIDEVNTHIGDQADFCFMPGDNANNGTRSQYELIKAALGQLRLPVHVIPGDHDKEPGTLEPFYSTLGVDRLPQSLSIKGFRCLFLDVVSAGQGGPDFQLSPSDLDWLEGELIRAQRARERCLLFMHTYPADLKSGAQRLLSLMRRYSVLVVDMGHTHYNELANDGQTIFAVTRSTGQVEEGPVGFSIMNLEGSVVSWRFKALRSAWPFVMITSPADVRLVTKESLSEERASDHLQVVARAWSDSGIRTCRCRFDDGKWAEMERAQEGATSRWILTLPRAVRAELVFVEAVDGSGAVGLDEIDLHRSEPSEQTFVGDGSDADRVGPWREKHIFDTQLGPNRNGRHW